MSIEKTTAPIEHIIQSLIALRNEMFATGNAEVGYKINSCLYSQYPINHIAFKPKAERSSWVGHVDRQGGSFTQAEIDNAGKWR